jgi:hypothetical protein
MATNEFDAQAWLEGKKDEWAKRTSEDRDDDHVLQEAFMAPVGETFFGEMSRRAGDVGQSVRRAVDPPMVRDVLQESVLQDLKESADEEFEPWAAALVKKGLSKAEDVYYGSRRAAGVAGGLLASEIAAIVPDAISAAKAIHKDVDLPPIRKTFKGQSLELAGRAAGGIGEYADPRDVSKDYARRVARGMLNEVDNMMRARSPYTPGEIGQPGVDEAGRAISYPAAGESERMHEWDDLTDRQKLNAIESVESMTISGQLRLGKEDPDLVDALSQIRQEAKAQTEEAYGL